jgi:prepilin-type N-terminal cleavage/methylation domain-containing protein
MNQRAAGFTLTELMVTIVIVAVLSLVVAPSFVRLVTNQRLQGAGNELASDLQYARSEALSRNMPVRLVTRNDGRGYDIVTVPVLPETPVTLKRMDLPAGFTLTPNISVQYEPMRAMSGADSTLLLDSGRGTQLQLSASERGQVQMCSPGGSLSSFPRCA